MFEKLSEYLNSRRQEQQKSLIKTRARKIILLETVLHDFWQFNVALDFSKASYQTYKENPSSFNESDKEHFFSKIVPRHYKENLTQFNETLKDDLDVPITDSAENEVNKFWKDIFQNDEFQLISFEYLLSPEFKVPRDPIFIILFLQLTLIYYAYLAHTMPIEITAKIDIVAMELVRDATAAVSVVEKRGQNHDRVLKSADAKGKGKKHRETMVLECYYKTPAARTAKNLHQAAWAIKEKLGKKSPSIDTIKRYLKKDGKF